MTRKEAIGIWLPMVLMAVHDSPQCEEAVKMAGRALEKEPIIDKIRAEIIQMPTISWNANDIYKADVLAIIDKYKEEIDLPFIAD